MAGSDRDSFEVQRRRKVVWMHIGIVEGDQPGAHVAADRRSSRHLGHQTHPRRNGPLLLVRSNFFHANRLQVVDGGAHPDGAAIVGRAGLKFPGNLVPRRLLEGDVLIMSPP